MMFCETHKDGTIVSNKPECMRAAHGTPNRCVITNYTKTSFVKELTDLLLDAWGKDASELEALLCDSCERRRWDAVQAREVSELWASGGTR